MNEKLAKKLSKILAKAGLEDDEVEKILADVEEALAEEVPQEGDNPDENQLPPSEEEGDVPPSEEGAGDVPPDGDLPIPPTPEGDVPPQEGDALPPQEGDGSIEDALGQLAAQEGDLVPPQPQEEVPPVPQEPQVPQFDPSVIVELTGKLDEANKTIDALKAQVDSLFNSLKEAGVISGGESIGDETPRVTPNANSDQEDAFDDIIATINGK